MEELLNVKFTSKRREHPPLHSYAYIRQRRKERRSRKTALSPIVQSSEHQYNSQPDQLSKASITSQAISNALRYTMPLMTLPPGIDVTKPPPPLPLVLPQPSLVGAIRPPFVPVPRSAIFTQQLSVNAKIIECNTRQRVKLVVAADHSPVNFSFCKPSVPHGCSIPCSASNPMQPQPNPRFTNVPNSFNRSEISRAFAEHSIKAALGMPRRIQNVGAIAQI
ncbi:uncharacterized protein LOC143462722 [Clavelina lepadiformis]|uniref:uncharacterized protein LOC143462722 n=1 Tax=Clavelina lepadiformis TaxID=159417 RepID=UPI0040416565